MLKRIHNAKLSVNGCLNRDGEFYIGGNDCGYQEICIDKGNMNVARQKKKAQRQKSAMSIVDRGKMFLLISFNVLEERILYHLTITEISSSLIITEAQPALQ